MVSPLAKMLGNIMKNFFIVLLICLMSGTAEAQEKITVLLDWFANPDHAPLFVAEEQGFFKEAGLDVSLIGPADPADPPKLVAAGKADIAITYEPQFIEQVEEGLPLIRIATLIDKPLSCMAVLENSSIKNITDLKGKSIGYSSGGIADIVLKTMLKHNHVDMNDVQMINVHYDLTQALLSKKIDAVTGLMRTFEVIQLDLANHPARVFLPENNGVPTYSELILVVNKNKINDKRFPKFIAALQKGVDYLQKHPDDSWKLFVKAHPELNDQLNQRAFVATLPYFAKKPGEFNAKEWEEFEKFMQKNGLIKKIHPVTDYAVHLT